MSGSVIVLSAVGSAIVRIVSKSSAVAPSKTKAFLTAIFVESTVVVVPWTVKLPVTVKFPVAARLLDC